jgi:phosphoglycerate dehydrogenase-like enzyme
MKPLASDEHLSMQRTTDIRRLHGQRQRILMSRQRGLYILDPNSFGLIYGPDEQRDIAAQVEIIAPPLSARDALARPELLAEADVIFSGWKGPMLDEAFFAAAAKLKAIFYGAGTMGYILTPAVWERGIVVTSALEANAVPVAEYTLATILFSLKHGWKLARDTRKLRIHPDRNNAPGCYGSTVGLVSLGAIARKLLKLLRPFDLNALVYDPFLAAEDAELLGVEQVSLAAVFERADVVSLHAPSFPETRGMITGEHFASMKPGATFINTSRGELVREEEMIEVLSSRPDLQAVLDVTIKEPPEAESPFYNLENVVLTPHIAGSAGNECRRMGRYMVEEVRRYLAGEPLKYALTEKSVMRSSHRPVEANVRRPARATTVMR